MNLILARHGNTFSPNDPVVWAGATNDLPLVKKGVEQAHILAEALLTQAVIPARIYCSPLQRTRSYAEIISARLGLATPPQVDPRLNEIDYGQWTGLTDQQVAHQFGAQPLRDWQEKSLWPSQGNWGSSAATVIQEIQSFVTELLSLHKENETLLVVSSNGKLRYFLTLVPGEFDKRVIQASFKMKTGNIAKLRLDNGTYSIPYWNQQPNLDLPI